ncbi:MAG: hypothetical protein AAFY99_00925 [Pseudomonadota bacterium]
MTLLRKVLLKAASCFPVVRTIDEGDSDACIAAISDWPGLDDWISNLKTLADDDEEVKSVTQMLTYREKTIVQLAARIAYQELKSVRDRCSAGCWLIIPLLMIVLSIIVPMCFWMIGEEVYSLRSDAYYALSIIRSLRVITSVHTTPGACRRLFRDYGATLPVAATMYLFPACFDRFRHLYNEYWFTSLATVLTCFLVYLAQYHWPLTKWVSSKGYVLGHGGNDAFKDWFNLIDGPYQEYQSNYQGAKCGIVHNASIAVINEAVQTILKILKRRVPDEVGSARSLVSLEVSIVPRGSTIAKAFLTLFYFMLGGVAFFLLLIKEQWGSVSQTAFAIFAVGIMLVMMTFSRDYSLHAFLDYFLPMATFMAGALFAVILPQTIAPDLYDDYSTTFWRVYVGMYVFTFALSGVVLEALLALKCS